MRKGEEMESVWIELTEHCNKSAVDMSRREEKQPSSSSLCASPMHSRRDRVV